MDGELLFRPHVWWLVDIPIYCYTHIIIHKTIYIKQTKYDMKYDTNTVLNTMTHRLLYISSKHSLITKCGLDNLYVDPPYFQLSSLILIWVL